VRPLVTSCASREARGGGTAISPQSKSYSTPGVAPGYGENPCVLNELENRGGGTETREGRGRGVVTEIIDRCQPAVRRASAAGLPSPSAGAPSCGVGSGAPRRGRPLAATNDSALTPCRVFRLQTPCSVLKQSPRLRPTDAVALFRTPRAAAPDGTGLVLNGGVGGTPGGHMSERLVQPISRMVGLEKATGREG
jgi:hypothetical protein